MPKHKRVCWEPQWDGPISGYAHNFCAQNHWRVASFMDYDDMIQEAYIKYLHCARKYPRVVEPKHFMRLFQIALTNRFNTLSNFASRSGERVDNVAYVDPEDGTESSLIDNVIGEVKHGGDLAVLYSQMPQEARDCLMAMLSGNPEQFRTGRIKSEVRRGLWKRETTNQFWCRIINADATKVNIPEVFRTLLSDA